MWRITNLEAKTFKLVQTLQTELKGNLDASWNEQGRLVVKGSESIRVFSSRERLFDSYKDLFALQSSATKVLIQNGKVSWKKCFVFIGCSRKRRLGLSSMPNTPSKRFRLLRKSLLFGRARLLIFIGILQKWILNLPLAL